MSVYILNELRKLVAHRANGVCEYCLLHESDSYITFQIDHIISLRHRGGTIAENLAFSCLYCNRNKCSDIGTILLPANDFIRFFNPRSDYWPDHFELEGASILPLTKIGEATLKMLDFNNVERIMERQILIAAGRYPGRLFS